MKNVFSSSFFVSTWTITIFLLSTISLQVNGFFPNLVPKNINTPSILSGFGVNNINKLVQEKKDLLDAISFTENGKSASVERQQQVIELVRKLESQSPPSKNLLIDPKEAKLLDGVWYLQYTSPSEVDQSANAWKPKFESKEPIRKFKYVNNGSVSAVGIKVDTASKVVQQIIDVENNTVTNIAFLDFGTVKVGGSFRPSDNVPNRVIATFEQAIITFKKFGLVLDLGFVFSILAKIRGSSENGWLETTYVDESIRIGRGNAGTLFVLTRDPDAVQP